MRIKHNPLGWMKQLAAEKRKATEQEIDHIALVTSVGVLRAMKKGLWNVADHLEATLQQVLVTATQAGCTDQDYRKLQLAIVHRFFGDPKLMHAANGQKMHSIPYWNPTNHRVNIAPMGIVKSVDPQTREATFYDFVGPGEHIMIPTPYTQGGKLSTVRGVAPQLRPLPREIDDLLDLEPIMYAEWCTWLDCSTSNCCKKAAVWYDKGQRLVCSKCGRNCKGVSF